MKIVMNNPSCGHILAKIAGITYDPAVDVNFCNISSKNNPAGGTLLTDYTGWSMQVHIAALMKNWATRDMLFATFDYPFNQLKVKRLFGQVMETNERAIKLNLHIGFRTVGRIEGVFRHDVACIVMRMDREDCRFLNIQPRTIQSNVIDAVHAATLH